MYLMFAHVRHIATGSLLILLAVPLLAEDARQLYEFKFKDPKNDGYFQTLQEKYIWFRLKKGFHAFDAYSGKPMWSHKELPDFDGQYTLLVDESYLIYSTKKGANRLNALTGEVEWSTSLEKLKFKNVDRNFAH